MQWDDLRHFLAAARAGQVTAAGLRLGVDQATVGRRITQLERDLGVKLFDRGPRGYVLTETGQRLLGLAEEVEATVGRLADAVTTRMQTLSGSIRIGAPEGVASQLISRGTLALCRTNPDLEVQVVALPRVFSLSRREVDFAIAVQRPERGRLTVRRIADFKLHIYAAPAYLERHPVRDKADLRRCRGIGYVPDLIFSPELDYIPQIDPTLVPRLTSTSPHVQLEWAAQGAGLCVLPDYLARRRPELRRVIPDKVEFTRTFWLVIHEDNARLERIRRCAEATCAALVREIEGGAEAEPAPL